MAGSDLKFSPESIYAIKELTAALRSFASQRALNAGAFSPQDFMSTHNITSRTLNRGFLGQSTIVEQNGKPADIHGILNSVHAAGVSAGTASSGSFSKAASSLGPVGSTAGALWDFGKSVYGYTGDYLGLEALSNSVTNYVNPQLVSSTGGSSDSIGNYINGGYCFSIVANTPTRHDLQALDTYFQWNGIAVSETAIPNLTLFSPHAHTKFTYYKTNGAHVGGANRMAAIQMAKMLNAGFRFWNTGVASV